MRESTSQEPIVGLTTVCHFERVICVSLNSKEGRGERRSFEMERMNVGKMERERRRRASLSTIASTEVYEAFRSIVYHPSWTSIN